MPEGNSTKLQDILNVSRKVTKLPPHPYLSSHPSACLPPHFSYPPLTFVRAPLPYSWPVSPPPNQPSCRSPAPAASELLHRSHSSGCSTPKMKSNMRLIDNNKGGFTYNSLRPSDAIWRWRSRSTLAQVMACCLTAPSHYLNQCWLMISEVLWHSPDNNFTENTDIYRWNEFEIY